MEDTRNLIDEYKGLTNEQVFDELNKKRNQLEIAIENIEHDFNMGSIPSCLSYNLTESLSMSRIEYP